MRPMESRLPQPALTLRSVLEMPPSTRRCSATVPLVTLGTSASVSSNAAACAPSATEVSSSARSSGSGMRGQSMATPSALSPRYCGE